jgi:zinc protease
MRFMVSLISLVVGLQASWAADPVETTLLKTAKSLYADLRVETLPNGLKVYLLPVKSSPVVTTMVAYKVGACDEDKDQTGLSHYLEHLLFKGTDKLVPGDVDRATQRNGGANNAYTSEDMTVYHFDFAADRWKIALEIEADRMRNTRIDDKHEFQQEKGAVISELKGGEDRPWDLEYKAILPRLYVKEAPYSHPVIGEESHVRGATAEIIKRYYDKWYHPNNASLVIVGGFDSDEALSLVKKLFSSIPKSDLPARKTHPNTPPRTKQVRHQFTSKFEVPRLMMGWNTVPSGHADDLPLMLLGQVLSSGKTSRLYKRMVEGDRIATEASASSSTGRFPGWFSVKVELLQGKDRAKTEAIVFEELTKVVDKGITEAELKRVKRSLLAEYVYSKESVHSLADLISQTVTLHDVDYLNSYLDKILAVTPADLQRVAKEYLKKDSSVVIWSVPEEEGGKGAAPEKKPAARSDSKLWRKANHNLAASGLDLTKTKRVVLPNGLKLLMLENRRLPIVVADVYVADTRLVESDQESGLAAFVGSMLNEGTKTRSGDEISTLIEDVGGSLGLSSSGGSLKVLTPDTDLGLSLLFDSLQNPAFPAEAMERIREQQLNAISESETQPQNRASNLFNKSVYGKHPFGRTGSGLAEVVKKLTVKDCERFHKSCFIPNNTTVVVVGDFDTAEMEKKIDKLTADWKKGNLVIPEPAAPPTPKMPEEIIVSDATASQTHVYIGHLGITRKHEDYHTLLVMDNVLGTGPGFTDRLSSNLRDRQGLAYTVRADISSSAGEQPGMFRGYIGTFPDKYRIAREGFLGEIGKIRDTAPTKQEVEDAKAYILGSLPFRLTTNAGVAGQILTAERFGLGFDFLDKFKEKVQVVTPAMVQEAAKKHLRPQELKIVVVGPIDQKGLPLPTPKEK